MPLIEQTPERYLRSPRLEPVADGGALLHVLAWTGEQECILRFEVTEEGIVEGGPSAGKVPTPTTTFCSSDRRR